MALNHCQYLIPEAMILKVKERCGEWMENQLTRFVPFLSFWLCGWLVVLVGLGGVLILSHRGRKGNRRRSQRTHPLIWI